jgi:Putative prokaryotic signal transducing protein
MSLVRIATPETETHLALISSALEAAEIPFFVHGNGMGGLMPGLQIASYNTRSVMVPQSCVETALAAIADLQPLSPPAPSGRDKLRILTEALFLGWFFPAGRRRRETEGGNSDSKSADAAASAGKGADPLP